ncbi:putative NRPS-like enzyme [Aspergillus californicus]
MSAALSPSTGLAQLLKRQLRTFGNGVAIEHGSNTTTFRELHQKALFVVQTIRKHGVQREEPIPILASRGLDHIVSQVAVVYAGATCVPLDVDLPDDYILDLLRHLGSSVIVTDIENSSRCASLQHIVVDYTSYPQQNSVDDDVEVSTNGPMSCTHLFHTSGSTGKPKAVRVLGMGVMNLVFNDFCPVVRGSRLGHVCNIGFDVSMWEMWSSLLQGATLIVFRRHELLDAPVFEQKLLDDRIDVLWQTTSLLATITHTRPGAYSTVDTLLTGGEAINIQTIRTIFDNGAPRRLFNVYGPTELSVFATYHQISPEDVQTGDIPIGKPLSGYHAFVLDGDLHPVPDGEAGELVVGGAGVAAGYFANPDKTAMAFVSASHLSVPGLTSTGLLYRTGDFVKKNTSGLLEYIGRRDNEVKVRGQRVDLECVERCLLQTKLVSTAVALRVADPRAGWGSALIAHVIPSTSGVDDRSIKLAYIEHAPNLMIPRLKIVDKLPLTRSGKVDRRKVARDVQNELGNVTVGPIQGESTERDTPGRLVRRVWGETLGLTLDSLRPQDDFFALGGTSLHVARLVARVNQLLDISLRVASIFESPTLESMSTEVTKLCNGVRPADGVVEVPPWVQDASIGLDLKAHDLPLPNWESEFEGRVFLTGSTGFVGAFLLMDLLAHPHVKAVACLVRAENAMTALLRIKKALARFDLTLQPAQEAKILPISGDLAEAYFGLGEDRYQHFASWSSVVFHLGAHINFVQPYSSHRPANVLGTINVIRFSQAGRPKALHYTSSISAYGPTGLVTGCRQLPEDERPGSHAQALSYDTGYAQSKFAAESIVWNAIDNGLPVAIYRLGFVLAHSQTGTLNSDDFFGRLVRSCIQHGSYPSLAGHHEDFVSVDFAVSSLVHISTNASCLGRAYNIVHPEQPGTPLSTVFDLINKHVGKPRLREVEYARWIEIISQTRDSPLSSLMPMLKETVWEDRSQWQMQEDMPEFGRENLRRVLDRAPELLRCSSSNSLIEACIPHWLNACI